MMATNIVTSSSTSPTPSDSTSVSAESGKSGLAGIDLIIILSQKHFFILFLYIVNASSIFTQYFQNLSY